MIGHVFYAIKNNILTRNLLTFFIAISFRKISLLNLFDVNYNVREIKRLKRIALRNFKKRNV